MNYIVSVFIFIVALSGCEKSIDNVFEKREIFVKELTREYLVYIPQKPGNAKPLKVLVFLHGLISPEEIFPQFLQIIQAVKHLDSVMVVFPIGLENAFPLHPDMLGWTPGCFDNNVLFLEQLLAQLNKDYKINASKVVAGGFSNGAYFLSQILQSDNSRLFSGFWLQGGGNPQPLTSCFIRKKVFLEVGRLDTGNLQSVRELKSHLLKHGWEEGRNFVYVELDIGHHLYLKNIATVLENL